MRKRMVDGVEIPFTPAQEAARDAEEAAWIPKKARIDIEDTFQASLQAARGSHTAIALELYRDIYQEIKERRRDSGVDTELLDAFAASRGVTRQAAAIAITGIIKTIKEGQATALGVRDEAIAALP